MATKKLIEVALPLEKINAESAREKSIRHGHPSTLHLWWARRPLAAARAVIWSSLVDDPSSHPDKFSTEEEQNRERQRLFHILEDLVVWENSNNEQVLEAAKAEILKSTGGNPPELLDPFAGGGAIPLEAQRLGLKAHAHDLNPVAVMINKAMIEIPPRFAGRAPVNPEARTSHMAQTWSRAQGLAEDVRYYGEWMKQEAYRRIGHLYPKVKVPREQGGGEATVIAWIWARTVKCPNPACSCQIPLSSSYILSQSKTAQYWAEPVLEKDRVRFRIHEGPCPDGKESNKVGNNGARFRCPVCGEITTDEYIKKMGAAHELGAEMMAVVTNTGGKKSFFAPDEIQEAAADVPPQEDVPPGVIPTNAHWFSPPSYGITEYADLFTPRQMRMLSTFSDLVREAQDMAASAALAAGMSETGGSLEAGGTGALAYGQAIGLYLAFVVDKMADYNSSMCSWRTAGGNIRSTFGRQAIPMVWTFAEGNPFSGVSGNFKTMLSSVVGSVEHLGCGTPVAVTQENALAMEHPKDTLVCTELPYYRDIGYADLSDFFYIWLRRSLKETYPQMFVPMVTPKEELSTVSAYYGVTKEEAEEKYRSGIKTVCERLYACSSMEYPALLFYCFRKNDLECMKQGSAGGNQSAWEFMLESLLSADFSITAVWPMRSEPVSGKADSTRVLIVARKGEGRQGQATRRGFINTLKRELLEQLQRLWSGHLSPEDELLSCIGQGLHVFSQYQSVLNADGSTMCVHDALQVIYLECEDYIAQKNEAASERVVETEEE